MGGAVKSHEYAAYCKKQHASKYLENSTVRGV